MVVQLATRIDLKSKATLDRLHEKTHIPIRQLTEKAIALLAEYYKQLQNTYKESDVNSSFSELLAYSIKKHDKTYKKLAE